MERKSSSRPKLTWRNRSYFLRKLRPQPANLAAVFFEFRVGRKRPYIMKTLAAVVLSACSVVMVSGQEENGVPVDPGVPGVIYEAPVVYQAPVIYQAPVAYYAPVYYLSGAYLAPQACPTPCFPPCPAPSTVTYIGHGVSVQANYGSCGSSVIHFGGQQGSAYGYRFNLRR